MLHCCCTSPLLDYYYVDIVKATIHFDCHNSIKVLFNRHHNLSSNILLFISLIVYLSSYLSFFPSLSLFLSLTAYLSSSLSLSFSLSLFPLLFSASLPLSLCFPITCNDLACKLWLFAFVIFHISGFREITSCLC